MELVKAMVKIFPNNTPCIQAFKKMKEFCWIKKAQ
jgi:hypothetical protein